ncbi:hypothetical protein J4226_04470 [Candidatus Pacearchaeota archaeon]|nr:hypothetical protein [Candidatus Pacearchaeota archaeon]
MKIEILLIMALFAIFSLINVSALSATVHVPEKYNEVNAGDRFYFELAIRYPENPTRVDLRLEYEVVDDGGEVVTQAKALKAVETQASFLDFVVLPEKMDYGKYEINVYVKDYGDLSEKVGSSFYVTKNRVDMLFTYIYLLALAVFFLMIAIIVILFRGVK